MEEEDQMGDRNWGHRKEAEQWRADQKVGDRAGGHRMLPEEGEQKMEAR
jgi:hypothetical protein